MSVDSNAKVILLPKEREDIRSTYKLIKLPLNSETKKAKSFLLKNSKIYELIEIKGNNPYSNRKSILLKNNESVKSFIFENDQEGIVIQSSNLIVSSQFNLVYLLISLMYDNEVFSKRFITFEDFIDTLTSLLEGSNEWVNEIPNELYINSLKEVCEVLNENNEEFFKFSNEMTFKYLTNKINKLIEYIGSKENSIILKIKSELMESSLDCEIPENIVNLSILNHSINLICNSYLPRNLKNELIRFNKFDFDELDSYIEKLNSKKKELEIVESNMKSIVETTSKSKSKKKVEIKKKVTKRDVKKVPVGKGALDGFFKKA